MFIFIPGYMNSEPKHWQRLWLKDFDKAICVEQDNWSEPNCDKWTNKLNETLKNIDKKKIVIAHSMGCTTFIEWANKYFVEGIKGVLLVAPPDIENENFPKSTNGFKKESIKKLPFKTLIVASEDDKYSSFKQSEELAKSLDCPIINVGKKGHINLDSNLGTWEEGQNILKGFVEKE